MKRQHILIIIGVILLIVGGAWRFILGSRFDQRFPDGWSWELNTIGRGSYADEATGQFAEGTTLADDPVNNTFRSIVANTNPTAAFARLQEPLERLKETGVDVMVDATGEKAGEVFLIDYFATHNGITNAIDWEFARGAMLDAQTGQYTSGEFEGDNYFIPRHAEKTNYIVTNSSYISLPMAYKDEEDVSGMNTYHYNFTGDLPNTLSYSYMTFEEGQQVICFGFELDYWVEPTTGEIIKYREWCEGDYVVDANGERLYGLQRWGSESTVDDILRRIDAVQGQLNAYNLNYLYLPLILLIAGVLALGGAFLPGLLMDKKEGKVAA